MIDTLRSSKEAPELSGAPSGVPSVFGKHELTDSTNSRGTQNTQNSGGSSNSKWKHATGWDKALKNAVSASEPEQVCRRAFSNIGG